MNVPLVTMVNTPGKGYEYFIELDGKAVAGPYETIELARAVQKTFTASGEKPAGQLFFSF